MGKKRELPSRSALGAWYRRLPGRLIQAAVRERLDPVVSNLFGYYLVQIGASCQADDLLSQCRVQHHFLMDEKPVRAEGLTSLAGDAEHLPLKTDTIDTVVLCHVLEFCEDPHQVLREVDRVLVPEGRVILVGFNPWGLWGLWRLLVRRWQPVPWQGRFLGCSRLKEWLSLLGYDVEMAEPVFCSTPFYSSRMSRYMRRLENLGRRWRTPFSGAWVLVARKRVSTVTPIRPGWRPRARLVAGTLVEPSTRTGASRDAG